MLQNATIKFKKLWLLVLVGFLPGLLKAQLAAQYGYTTLLGTYTPVTGSTAVPGILADDATSTGIPIGFTFTFCGNTSTTVSVCSNGFLSLSNTTITAFTNTASNISGTGFLMPYWDDGYGATTGAVASYVTTGTAPNRVFTFEWKNWGYCCATTVYQSYQVKLYETTNVIEFWYQPVVGNTTRSATIGIANSSTDWQTLNSVAATAISSSTVFTDGIPNQPDSGRIFRYTPPPPCTGAPTITGITPATPVNACLGSTVSYNATLLPALNVSYQWESAASCAGPWTAVAGATTTSYTTPLITGPAFYHFVATCTTAFLATTSACQSIVPPALFPAGTYTINAGLPTAGTNYHSVSDAVNAIKCGIAGPVVFNAVPGTSYNEQVVIPSIFNTSTVNTVTFNGNYDTLGFTNNVSGNSAVVLLNDADYITFKKWKIIPGASGAYGFGLELTNNADHNLIDSNIISIATSVTSSNFAGVVVNGSTLYPTFYGSYCDSNTISNNNITGGYYALTLFGNSSTDRITGNIISNNIIKDFYSYGMMLYYTDATIVRRNDISRPTRTTLSTFWGIYSWYGGNNQKIYKNRLHDPFGADSTNTNSAYGLYLNYALGSSTAPIEISNNALYNFKSNGVQYGIYDNNNLVSNVVYNSISFDYQAATTSTTYGLYLVTTAANIKDNIFSVTRGGTANKYCLYRNSGTPVIDYNDYYKTPGVATAYVGYYGGTVATLSAWQTATGGDVHSKALNPNFTNPAIGNLTPSNDTLNDTGIPITGITTDILNAVRKPLTPDMGAFEFAHRCDGPAYPGIASTSDTGMCTGYQFILTDTTYQKDVSYLVRNWQQSSNGGNTWYDIAGSTSKDSLHLIFPATSMKYRVRIICSLTGDTTFSNAVSVILKPPYKCYCYSIANGGTADTSDIGAFAIANFTTNTGGPHVLNPVANRGRTDYTDYGPIVLYKDSSYAVSVYHTLKDSAYGPGLVTMFMDYNNNLVYDYNTNESITLNTTGNSASSWTSYDPNGWYIINHITIPHAVITNVPTGLRLVLNNNTSSSLAANPQSVTGCGAYTSGETEDYVVIFKERFITSINSIAGLDEFVVYPNPNNGLFSVSFKAQQQLSNVQVVVTDITGRVIQSVSYGDVSGGKFLKNIDLSQQAKGVYLVELRADNQKIFEKVMVK